MQSRLIKKMLSKISEANNEWDFFSKGEKIIIGISGGKDSLVLLDILKHFELELIPVHVNTHSEDIFDEVKDGIVFLHRPILKEITKRKNPCFTCSKRKRQALLEYADKIGVEKIAFGHHLNDVIETTLLNQIFSREISTMMPKQTLFQGRFFIIRPLYLLKEQWIMNYVEQKDIVPFSASCPYENKTKREYIKNWIKILEKEHPKIDIEDNLFSSLKHIKADYLPYKIIKSEFGRKS